MRVALSAHPDAPADGAFAIAVTVGWADDALSLDYELSGDLDKLSIPPPVLGKQTDGLWRTTCFEAFVQSHDAPGYREYNFAPSTDWAVYGFDAYREGMAPLDAALGVLIRPGRNPFILSASVFAPGPRLRLGLSAVLEEKSGTKSYWALAHAPGKPDFHHPDGFVLELPATP